jgi:alpha-L-rhamnosidase
MAGQTTITVEDCPSGTNITLFHNEILNEDGTVNRNLAPMVGTYICAGTGIETYRTHFTYYGFRYVQINGWPGVPGEEAVAAHFVHSAVPQSGEFSSSNELLNAVQHATRFASWSNMMDIPTDCPQRERFGWLGDARKCTLRRSRTRTHASPNAPEKRATNDNLTPNPNSTRTLTKQSSLSKR